MKVPKNFIFSMFKKAEKTEKNPSSIPSLLIAYRAFPLSFFLLYSENNWEEKFENLIIGGLIRERG